MKAGVERVSKGAEDKHISLEKKPSFESKLKQPETTIPKSLRSGSLTSNSFKSISQFTEAQPTKKVPPPPEKYNALHSGPILANGCQHEAKDIESREAKHTTSSSSSCDTTCGGNSLHQVNSVQSLANEIRRIRSLRIAEDDQVHQDKATQPEDKDGTARKQDKKPIRSKLKLDLSACIEDDGKTIPNCESTQSPVLSHGSSANAEPKRDSLSPGKKRIHRDFADRLGMNFELDLKQSNDESKSTKKSYDLSASGTFDALGFQIKQTGLTTTKSPNQHLKTNTNTNTTTTAATSATTNTKKHLIKLGVLGRGASGVVHKALHVPSLSLVAVKVIPVFEDEKRHQLIAELRALYTNLSSLNDEDGNGGTASTVSAASRRPSSAGDTDRKVACPEIVCLYDAYMNPNEGNVSIVVEFMDGGSLQDIVDTGGCKNESVLANISYRVLKGLAFLHQTQHQLHRDIKPSNLLINHLGHVKVSDFGIAREMENSMAKATTFVGTLTYMSPERIASEEYSYKSDVWSFGLSIMTCALGKFPYSSKGYWELLHMIRNEPPPKLPKDEFSAGFREFIDKCLQKDQNERWSVKQLLQHDFVKACGQGLSSLTSETVDEDPNAAHIGEEEEEKMEREMDEMMKKVVDYYMKNAKELVHERNCKWDEMVAWVQTLPPLQTEKLNRFVAQTGVNRNVVCEKFQQAMKELLLEIQDTFFDENTTPGSRK